MYKKENGNWSGFGSNTPVAYNDGKTDYGYIFHVAPNDGYQLASSNLKVIYNGEDVTSTAKVSRWPWGAYVTVDLGKAIGENPTTYKVIFNSNGGTEIPPKEVVSGLKIKAPSTPTKDKYLFKGWYEDSTFSKKFDFNTPITGNITLYAKWEAANSINEVKLAGDYQYGTVPVGTLPSFNPRTMTDSITIDKRNSDWMYKKENGNWSGFGSNTPVAYNDGKTDYGYIFHVAPNDGYQLASSNLKVIYNGEDVTSTAKVSRWPWGAYVTVDLGKANGIPVVYTVTFNSNDGTEVAPQNVNVGEKLTEPTPAPTKEGFTFDGWYEDSTFSKKFDFNTPITGNITLYAKWVENKYTLTFDANGGSGSMAPKADLTGEYTLPSNEFTAPSGKQFKGWSLTADGAIVTKVEMTENKTVYAIWEDIPVVTYTVAFNSNDGTEVAPQNVNAGEKLTEPTPAPTKEGFTFDGWYEDSTFSKKFDFNTPITGNITLYAKWVENKYTLTFDANGGSGTMAPKADLTGEYTLPSNEFTAPTGKQFKGWSLTADGAIVTKVDMTENKTVYAIWEDIPVVTYTVTFNSNDGTEVAPQNVNAGEKLTEPTPAPTKAGFTFDGWYEDSTFSKKFDFNTPITGNITLYAKWVENKYTLTFDANGGSGSMAPKADLTGEYTLPSNEFTAPSGKQFKGWSLTADGAIVTKVDMTENKTVYAIWEDIPVVTYTVTFNSNDGTEVAPKNVNAGDKLTEPTPAPTKAGFTFDGWYEDSTFSKKFDFNTPITGNITLYAKWVENKYTLTFDANGGSGSMAPKADLTGEYTLPSNEFTAPSGKQFKGWSLTADGAIVTKVEMTENKTVYAIWQDIPVVTYKVTFNSNDGTEVAPQNVNAGEKLTEPTPAPTKAGFTFDGWYEDSTFSKKFDFNTPITGNITLYAKWVENKYTLTFDANGGSGSMAPKADLTGEYTLPSNEFTAPSGKQFKGWSLTADGAIVTKVDMTENKTVYAIWEVMYSYRFLENTGEQTIDGKAKSFKLVIDADENKFVSLVIGGTLYEKNTDYTVRHGSTIIEFTSAGLAKLNALSKGDYDVTLTFTDEVINGKLHVTAANPTVTPQKPNTDNPKPNTDSPKSNTDNVKNNPQTYDGTFSYIEILLVVILCLISVVIIGKKRSRNY